MRIQQVHTYRLVPALLTGLWLVAAALAGAEAPIPQYQIQMRLIQTMADGQEIPVYQPCVMTAEDQPAVIETAMKLPPPKAVHLQEPLRCGRFFLVKVFRNDGRLFLDATANLADPLPAGAEGVRIVTTGLRIVEPITLGKKILVPLPEGQNARWEFLVQEPQLSPQSARPGGGMLSAWREHADPKRTACHPRESSETASKPQSARPVGTRFTPDPALPSPP